MSQDETMRVRTLRALLTEYDTAKYAIRLPFNSQKIEQEAAGLRKSIGDTANQLKKFLASYEASIK